MDIKKLSVAVITGIILLVAVIFVIKLISGAVSIVTGLFNAILGIVVILALIFIVAWMFSYAKKNRK